MVGMAGRYKRPRSRAGPAKQRLRVKSACSLCRNTLRCGGLRVASIIRTRGGAEPTAVARLGRRRCRLSWRGGRRSPRRTLSGLAGTRCLACARAACARMARPAPVTRAAHRRVAHLVVSAMSSREYGAQDDESRQREYPKAQILAEGPEGAFGAAGHKENNVAGHDQHRGRKKRKEVDHRIPLPATVTRAATASKPKPEPLLAILAHLAVLAGGV